MPEPVFLYFQLELSLEIELHVQHQHWHMVHDHRIHPYFLQYGTYNMDNFLFGEVSNYFRNPVGYSNHDHLGMWNRERAGTKG